MEEICKDKIHSNMKSRDFSKRGSSKLVQTSSSMKFRKDASRFTSPSGFTGIDKPRQNNLRSVNSSATSVGSVRNVEKPICKHCGKGHFDECRFNLGTCFRYGSSNHFPKDCRKQFNDSRNQTVKLEITSKRGRKPGNGRGGTTG